MIALKHIPGLLLISLQLVTVGASNSEQQLLIQGMPPIENFHEQDFGAEASNYDIEFGDNNFLYVLNPRGILEYDGYQWRFIHSYLSTAKDRIHYFDNKLYYLKSDRIGYLFPNQQGFFQDTVLLQRAHLNIAHATHKIHNNGHAVYFISRDTIYVHTPEALWKVGSENALCASVMIRDTLFVNEYPKGISYLHDSMLTPYVNHPILEQNRVYNMAPAKGNLLLLSILYKGLFQLSKQQLHVVNTSNDFFGIGIHSDKYLLQSTLMNGIVQLNETGKSCGAINYATGLADDNMVDLVADNQKHIWACTKNGLSHLAVGQPFSAYNKAIGLPSHSENVIMHNNQVYICTRNGLFRVRKQDAENAAPYSYSRSLLEEVQGINALCFQAYSFDKYLLVSTHSGIYVVDKLRAVPAGNYSFEIPSSPDAYRFIKKTSRHDFYQIVNHKLTRTAYSDWMYKDLIFGKNRVWFTDSNRVTEVKINMGKFQEHSFNLPALPAKRSTYLFTDSTHLYCAERGRVHKYMNHSHEWITDSAFNSILDSNKMVVKCYAAHSDQRLLLSIGDINEYSNYTTAMYKKHGDHYLVSTHLSAYLGNIRINSIYQQSDALWWIATRDATYAFNPENANKLPVGRSVSIRKIENSGSNKTIWLGYGQTQHQVFPFSKSELSFQFITNSFVNRKHTRFSYTLEGYQDSWSKFSASNQVNFTNLREGEYTLQVKARFMEGTISNTYTYSFTINPPWYRSYLAYVLYIALVLLIGYLIFRWRLYTIQQDRKKLEQKVQLRTQQLNETNAQLTQKTNELEEMDKVKSNFFANISHELRTPLTLILGPLNKLIGKEKNKEKLHEFQIMQRNSLALKQHIEQFLELSKIESGNLTLHKEPVHVNAFVKRRVASFESLAKVKEITLSYTESVDNIYALLDEKHMEVVINNLLSNALKFTPKTGTVTIQLQKMKSQFQLSVNDTGIGISAQHLPYVFKRFYQADTSISKQYEGTGIGLALSKEIVEMHNGRIEVSSELNKGSCFRVSLAVSDVVPNPTSKPNSTLNSSQSSQLFYNEEEPNGKKDKPLVLVVEDNTDMQNYLKDLLRNQFEVHLAANGAEGLALAQKLNPHLIVSDVMMPIKDGFSMVDDIRAISEISHIPIIMLTARADEDSKLKGLRKGVEEYLSKPFSREELLIRIQNIIARRKATGKKVSQKLTLEPGELELSSMDEQFIAKAGAIIEQHLSNSDFDIQQLSDSLNMSRRHVYRKIKLLTDMSPSEFVRSYKLKKAAQMLQQKADTISQIAYTVGFDDLSYFSKCFKAQFGVTPKEFSA